MSRHPLSFFSVIVLRGKKRKENHKKMDKITDTTNDNRALRGSDVVRVLICLDSGVPGSLAA